ncbi:MAG TPA: hypothetical protein VFN89_03440 [Solirubrobacterales bacterium]|nr:hypothetical protein [Solirubrobacterales bacterium]
MSQSKVRLLGAVVNLALAVDRGDGGDLEPLQTDPIQLSPQAFREFTSGRLDAEIEALEARIAPKPDESSASREKRKT